MEIININTCPLCGIKGISHKLFNKNSFSIVECKNCGLSYVNPQPTKKFIDNYYKENKKIWNSNEKEYPISIYILKRIRKYVRNGDWLDIGCSEGHLLQVAKEKGFNVLGVELNEEASRIANSNGIKVLTEDFLRLSSEVKFNVVSMFRLFEHIGEPNSYLEKVGDVTVENGILAISVPNYKFGIFIRKFTKKFSFLSSLENSVNVFGPPSHLFHYSPLTMKEILERHGFYVFKIYNTYPTLERKGIVRNILKLSCYLTSQLIYFVSFKRVILNYNFWIIARKKQRS